jgi:hypothetical protein
MVFLSAAILAVVFASVSAQNSSSSTGADYISPPVYPSPYGAPGLNDAWTDAYAAAADFVSQLTLVEKVNITTGFVLRSFYLVMLMSARAGPKGLVSAILEVFLVLASPDSVSRMRPLVCDLQTT